MSICSHNVTCLCSQCVAFAVLKSCCVTDACQVDTRIIKVLLHASQLTALNKLENWYNSEHACDRDDCSLQALDFIDPWPTEKTSMPLHVTL